MKEVGRLYFNMYISKAFDSGLRRQIVSSLRTQDIYYSVNGVLVAHHIKVFSHGKIKREMFLIAENIIKQRRTI